jgi:hypothetical protein
MNDNPESYKEYVEESNIKVISLLDGTKVAGKVEADHDTFVRLKGCFQIIENEDENSSQTLVPYVHMCVKSTMTFYRSAFSGEFDATFNFKKTYLDGLLMMDLREILSPEEYQAVVDQVELERQIEKFGDDFVSNNDIVPESQHPPDTDFLKDSFPGRN